MSHLLWELTKNNNAFLVKRNGFEFSSDPYNLVNKNQYSFSGLAHNHSLSIRTVKKDKKSVNPSRYDLCFQKKRDFQQKSRVVKNDAKIVNPSQKSSFFAEHVPAKSIHTASKVIRKKLTVKRTDLVRAALRRLARAHRSNVAKKALAKTGAK